MCPARNKRPGLAGQRRGGQEHGQRQQQHRYRGGSGGRTGRDSGPDKTAGRRRIRKHRAALPKKELRGDPIKAGSDFVPLVDDALAVSDLPRSRDLVESSSLTSSLTSRRQDSVHRRDRGHKAPRATQQRRQPARRRQETIRAVMDDVPIERKTSMTLDELIALERPARRRGVPKKRVNDSVDHKWTGRSGRY